MAVNKNLGLETYYLPFVLAKYLKDRKGRELSLEEIEHFMKVAAAIRRTIEVQRKVDEVLGGYNRLKKRQRGIPQRMQTKKNHANIYEACLLGG